MTDDFVERRFIAFGIVVAADVGILGFEFGFSAVQLDVLVEADAFEAVSTDSTSSLREARRSI